MSLPEPAAATSSAHGAPVRESTTPHQFLLAENAVWIVDSGRIDLFLVDLKDGEPTGPRTPLVRIEAGQALFGLDRTAARDGSMLQAVGSPATALRRVERAEFWARAIDPQQRVDAIRLIDGWVSALCGSVARDLRPKTSVELHIGSRVDVEPATSVHPIGAAWVRHLAGSSSFLGRDDLRIDGETAVPLAGRAWLVAREASTVELDDTATAIERDAVWIGLTALQALVLDATRSIVQHASVVERSRLTRKAAATRSTLVGALSQIASILDGRTVSSLMMRSHAAGDITSDDALFLACRLVCEQLHIPVKAPPATASGPSRDPVRAIAQASRFRTRRVVLRDDWWRRDNGPLLGSMSEDRRPVALIPKSAGHYELYDTLTGTHAPVTAAVAATLEPFGTTFYRSFRDATPSFREVVRFGLQECRRDLVAVAVASAAGGVLALITPIAIGMLFNSIIPGAQRDQLVQITVILFACAMTSAMFQVAWSVALMRIDGKSGCALQAAVWDRLLSLPLPFFRQYSAGDLATRAMGVDVMRQILSGPTLAAILGGVLSLFNFALLFYYSRTLAEWALMLIAVAIATMALVGYLQLKVHRIVSPMRTKTSGLVLQLLTGIAKLRVAGAEIQGFALWARQFSRQRQLQLTIRSIGNWFSVFRAVFPIVSTMVIFELVVYYAGAGTTIRTGDFLAFLAALGGCMTATLATGSAVMGTLSLVPLYELATPILRAVPEVDEAKSDPGQLSGEIEIDHLVFRYSPDTPPTLHDVSVKIRTGEFLAVVGPSGSGKSTLFRLLLGFETPEAGAIYYDGQELSGLDVHALRQQIGVVLQSGRLMTGDLFTNIVGSSLATMEDAWEAARMAGLDLDIKQMPMGMHTVVNQGGGTLSGGQRQRLLVARAIVGRPRILFFDEATSALDNRTQAIVSQSLEQLQATRVVIAHRLSTIVRADRIVVMDRGRIVQIGSYDELMAEGGLFANLARRQVV